MALELNGTTGVSLVQDGVVATADLADNAVTSAKLFSGFANGITEADAWRISTTLALANSAVVSSNWERVDTGGQDGFGKLGTGLSESSGIFSFPSTGYWWINFFATCTRTNTETDEIGMGLNVTNDNFTGDSISVEVLDSIFKLNTTGSVSGTFLFNITDTANQKFRFKMVTTAGSGTAFVGNTGKSYTGFSIFKVAEV